MSVTDLLHGVSLFADLDGEQLSGIAGCLGRAVFAEDALLFQKGSPARSLYLIESGAVRIFSLSEDGQEITLDLHGPGECVGESALLDGSLRSTGAVAITKTVAYVMGRDDFVHCLDQYPQVAHRAMALLAHRLEHANALAEKLAFLDVARRVAAALLELAEHFGTQHDGVGIDLRLTQSELATLCAASREMVNKVLHTYREQGLITMQGRAILISDPAGLERQIGR